MIDFVHLILDNFKGSLYEFNKDGTECVIFKYTKKADKLNRCSYITTKDQCSCHSWLKTGNCKHQQMILGEYESSKGIPTEVGVQQLYNVVEIINTHFKIDQVATIDFNSPPDFLSMITIQYHRDIGNYLILNQTDWGDFMIYINSSNDESDKDFKVD